MRILVACEFSGIVRDAFIRRGHDAVSCDLLPSESDLGPHILGNVLDVLGDPWDMIIAHPPCRYLCHSGHPQFKRDPTRFKKIAPAVEFFKKFLEANAPRIAVESSFPHRWTIAALGPPDFTVSQRDFGGPGTKRACWWTKNLPPLMGTIRDPNARDIISGTTGTTRSKYASRFHPGMAAAMADQWGSLP